MRADAASGRFCRVGVGHRHLCYLQGLAAPPHPLASCNLPYWRDFALWGLGWADLIDFFARHNCAKHGPFKEYRFPAR